MRSDCSHLGSRHLALEPGRVRYSVVKGKAAGRSTMPGLHGCRECCVGCQLRCCCRPCGPDNPWSDLNPHLSLQSLSHAVCRLGHDTGTSAIRSYSDPTRPCREAGTSRQCQSPCPRSGAEAREMSHGQWQERWRLAGLDSQ